MSSFRFFVTAAVAWSFALSLSLAQDVGPRSRVEPEIAFKRGDASGAIRDSPGKNIKIKVYGSTAQLYDADTGKSIGPELYHDPSRILVNPRTDLSITCWAFSPDGKLIATGAGYKRVSRWGDVQENDGEVRVWEVATGKLLATERKGLWLGTVKRVAFSKDGKTVLVEAEQFDYSGR
jgi:WD40 repeat protein